MKEHVPLIRNSFKGLWNPSGTLTGVGNSEADESCPRDHLLACTNCDFTFQGLVNRSPFTTTPGFAVPFNNSVIPQRVHVIENIAGQEGDLLIGTTTAEVYYYDGTNSGVLLYTHPNVSIDFNFIPWENRIYIIFSRFLGFGAPAIVEGGMQVYQSSGIRPAGGLAPIGVANVANGLAGVVQAGVHFFGVSYETDTGFITPPQITNPPFLTAPGNQQVQFTNIPTGGIEVVARWIIATKVIPVRVPNDTLASYISYFAARINDNVTVAFNLDFRDTELLREASYLNDIYPVIPNGTSISSYRNRLAITAPGAPVGNTAEIHTVIISRFSDPETFDQVDGVIDVALTNQNTPFPGVTSGLVESQAYRDTLYLMTLDSTSSVSDSGDEPAFWPSVAVDQTIGARPNGIIPVKSPGSESVDYLLVAHTSGIYVFTGFYHRPEITWKVKPSIEIVSGTDLRNISTVLYLVNSFNLRKIYLATAVTPFLARILLIDYNNVNPDLSNYYMDVRISEWPLEGIPDFASLFLRNNFINSFTNTGILAQSVVPIGIGTPLDVVTSQIQFPSDRDEDDKMIHLKSVRIKLSRLDAVGTVTLIGIPPTGSGSSLFTSNPIDLVANIFIEPTITANVLAQRISYLLQFSENARFNLVKFVSYIKPVYSTIPYQYVP